MPKLNTKKVKWIVREKEKGDYSSKEIGEIQNISRRRVLQLWSEYRKTGKVPELKKAGRPRREVSKGVELLIVMLFSHYRSSSNIISKVLRDEYGIRIGHNKVQEVLHMYGFSKRRKKSKKKKWVRYERKHSMSLWHTDWYYISEMKKWLIVYLDDASRRVMSYGIYETPTTEGAIEVYLKGIEEFGDPEAVLTDRDTTFYASGGKHKKKGESRFEKFLRSRGVRHIVGRVHHPQTNGKIERFYQTLEHKRRYDEDIEDFIRWYNEVRYHTSLEYNGYYETPDEAFMRKLPPEKLLGIAMEVVLNA